MNLRTLLSSVAANLHTIEVADRNDGVHMMIPKDIFVSAPLPK